LSQSVTILGSTGSIGVNTLNVLARNAGRYHVRALTAHRNIKLLAEQCAEHRPEFAVISETRLAEELRRALHEFGSNTKVLAGEDGLLAVAGEDQSEIVMAAIVGAAGLKPTLAAAHAGKKILLANKESLVIAGSLFMQAARDAGATILPVDSEHNAIFQSLPANWQYGLAECGVERIILTASGGPFLDATTEEMQRATPEQACKHPNWRMGRKISVDSATLMNKGLELIEAHWLFGARPDQLEVVVHPQSIVHSMVAYCDGSVIAQMGTPDMRTPIAYSLAWPQRIAAGVEKLRLPQLGNLTFREPDLERFPCLGLAFEAMREGASAPIMLNAANEVAVQCFLDGQLRFDQIGHVVASVLERDRREAVNGLEDVLEFDRLARVQASEVAAGLAGKAIRELH
jgi:1-deoxy-D-xylulose-5-phosphate reductoisomerase